MKLSFIVPTAYVREFGSQSDFILALAHLIDLETENQYEKAIKQTELDIILDNGLFENHKPEPIESLIQKAIKIKATHFFAPDVLFDSKETERELNNAIELSRGSGLKVGAVVQADNYKDYWAQLLEFNTNPDVDLIGLSILSIPKSFEKILNNFDITQSRINLLQWMKAKSDLDGIVWKKCHLLGIGDSYRDVLYAKKYCPWVVSNDSSCAFQSGLYEKTLTDELDVPGGKVKEKVDFELRSLSTEAKTIIQTNISKIKKIIHDN